jgi:ATP-binding cassette, subfamily B, bacterial MsbA
MIHWLKADTRDVLKRLLGYVRPYRRVIVPAVLAIVVYALITGIVPLFMEDVFEQFRDRLLDSAEASASALDALRIPLLLALVFALRAAMDFLTIYGLSWVGRCAIRDLRTDLFRRYLYLPASFYDRNATGDLISRLTFNTEQIAEAISTSIVVIVRDFLLVIVMIGVMIYFSLELTLILAVVGPVVGLLLTAMTRAFRRYSFKIQNSMGDVTRIAGQALQGQQVVKIFAGQEYETSKFEEINSRNFRLHLRLVAARAFGDAVTQYVVILGIAAIVFLIFSGWLSQSIDSPQFMGFITAVAVLLTALKRMISTNAALQRGIAAGASVFRILDEPAEVQGAPLSTLRVDGAIEFVHVGFKYEKSQEDVLHDVTFKVEPGKTLAIVGRSGSGKSTLVSLLPRFYDVTSGAILLDGQDIRGYPLQTLRSQFSFVGQDVVLFDDTIAGNIAYGALSGASRAEIERAAEMAYVTRFTDELPGGLDSEVGERGMLLSGGQRQRIAIARALLRNAPVLVLDEATSSLDSESERHVQSALKGLMQGRTTLIIAHRLSTVERADRIIVMHDGRIVEAGTHVELLAAAGHYASLYRMQFADQ